MTFLDCYTGCEALEGAVVDDAAFAVVYHFVAVLCGQVCDVLCAQADQAVPRAPLFE